MGGWNDVMLHCLSNQEAGGLGSTMPEACQKVSAPLSVKIPDSGQEASNQADRDLSGALFIDTSGKMSREKNDHQRQGIQLGAGDQKRGSTHVNGDEELREMQEDPDHAIVSHCGPRCCERE